ncbi:MAG: hypothetical protein FD130_2636, partial [Halothiobacillaceae bacterium]
MDVYYNFATTCPTLTTDGAAGTKAGGSVAFDYAGSNTSKTVSSLTIIANGETLYSGAPGSKKPKDLDDFLNGKSSTNYTIIKNYGNDHTIKIEAKNAGTAWNGAISVTLTTTGSSPGYTKIDLSGGADANPSASTGATGSCQSTKHHHEYDDMYDVTGLNMLDASDIVFDLANAIPATTTQFKVLAHNQYLSPAAKIRLHGNPSYVYNI